MPIEGRDEWVAEVRVRQSWPEASENGTSP